MNILKRMEGWSPRKRMWVAFGLLMVIIGFSAAPPQKSRHAESAAAAPQVKPAPYQDPAMKRACREKMESLAVVPGTVKFQSTYDVAIAQAEGGSVAMMQSWMDSQNAMGAMVRTHFRCTAVWQPQAEEWKVAKIDRIHP